MTSNTTQWRPMLMAKALALAVLAAGGGPAHPQGTQVAGVHGAWTLHVNGEAANRLCFVSAAPQRSTPQITNRATAMFYITAWPADGVAAEASVKLGYTVKTQSKVAITIGTDTFKLTPKEERAFVPDAVQEARLIAAMRKGSEMTVQAVPARGQMTTDSYSLAGIAEALKAMAEACK